MYPNPLNKGLGYRVKIIISPCFAEVNLYLFYLFISFFVNQSQNECWELAANMRLLLSVEFIHFGDRCTEHTGLSD